MDSRRGGCHNWRNSRAQVARNTIRTIDPDLALLKTKEKTRHQNSTYKIPPRELFTHSLAGPAYSFV
jgi:hypothetical protein